MRDSFAFTPACARVVALDKDRGDPAILDGIHKFPLTSLFRAMSTGAVLFADDNPFAPKANAPSDAEALTEGGSIANAPGESAPEPSPTSMQVSSSTKYSTEWWTLRVGENYPLAAKIADLQLQSLEKTSAHLGADVIISPP